MGTTNEIWVYLNQEYGNFNLLAKKQIKLLQDSGHHTDVGQL